MNLIHLINIGYITKDPCTDTNDLIHNMPILGQEFLQIKLRTPNLVQDNEIIDNIFSVYKISRKIFIY